MTTKKGKQLLIQAEAILNDYNMKKTAIRTAILSFMLSRTHAISKNEIENKLPGQDRVTVYRTIKSFEEKGIIHRIQGFDEEPKYALNLVHDIKEHLHDKPHAHFHCLKCLITLCLPIKVPEIKMPPNFQKTSSTLAIQGICNNCLK